MKVLDKADDVLASVINWKNDGRRVGFVPTMGALHDGHLSLVRSSNAENDVTVISIFVNPTQFNDPLDFQKYPRTLQSDLAQLKKMEQVVVFHPRVEDIYPGGPDNQPMYHFGYLDHILEGEHRAGHFAGVGQVVARLLHLVPANTVYLGQKDYQQSLVIKKLIVEILGIPIEVVICPIIREPDGLAMSSRNVRLNVEQRKDATLIFQALQFVKSNLRHASIEDLERQAINMILKGNTIREVDYFKILLADSLIAPENDSTNEKLITLTAVQFDGVRLIDNILLY